jgi:hypothetical protein
MKNAYVLSHHHGDNGTVSEGMILTDITDQRFNALEKQGLVRAATDAEVKEGSKIPFEESGQVIAGEAEEVEAEEPAEKQAREPENKAAPKAGNKKAADSAPKGA